MWTNYGGRSAASEYHIRAAGHHFFTRSLVEQAARARILFSDVLSSTFAARGAINSFSNSKDARRIVFLSKFNSRRTSRRIEAKANQTCAKKVLRVLPICERSPLLFPLPRACATQIAFTNANKLYLFWHIFTCQLVKYHAVTSQDWRVWSACCSFLRVHTWETFNISREVLS